MARDQSSFTTGAALLVDGGTARLWTGTRPAATDLLRARLGAYRWRRKIPEGALAGSRHATMASAATLGGTDGVHGLCAITRTGD
ncbi:hypothetical protein GCM10009864_74270 [Streptomyces lunalinharesii]|uniref:Uncharacterized protein n=1 Tax=Streptomyces lunalinharesii TaxID=333384 RepID=A0ABP6FFX9_9ACTN